MELERTINSMSLAEERAILKKILKLQTMRQKAVDFAVFDRQIKEKKSIVNNLRVQIQEYRARISSLQTELETVNTALMLGCDVSSLVGTQVNVPADKIGQVIGRKGKNVQQLSKTVNVNFVRGENGAIRLVGTLDSLGAAKSNLDRVMQQTDESIIVPLLTHNYLTTSKIVALTELRDRHPNVHFQMKRLTNYNSHNLKEEIDCKVQIRGVPTDLEAFRIDILAVELVQENFTMSSRNSGLVVGKGGVTIGAMVQEHQTAIQIERPTHNTPDVETDTVSFTLIGPPSNVVAARTAICDWVALHQDVEEIIPMESKAKAVLLLHGGVGIQALRKQVNEATRSVGSADNHQGNVVVNVHDNGLLIKGRSCAVDVARSIVKSKVTQIEGNTVQLTIDPLVMPIMIGKSGQGIKALKRDTTTVAVEFDRDAGQVFVMGLERDQVDIVVVALEEVKNTNFVERLRLECDESSHRGANSFMTQFRSFQRTSVAKKIRDLVYIATDDNAKQIILRGKPESVTEASVLLRDFLAQNYLEELPLTQESLTALLSGGKNSKIVELANQTGVTLSTDRDRQVLLARGEKEKVIAGMYVVKEFLFGSSDVKVETIELDNADLMGVVIGKGGKQKMDLQERFPNTSITFHRSEAAVTLRGPADEVNNCHADLTKIILGAKVTRTTELSDKQIQGITKSKFMRRVTQTVPVQVVFSPENVSISFRGSSDDVQEALAMLKEELEGVRETGLKLDESLFQKVQNAAASHLENIEARNEVKIAFEDKTSKIVFSGKPECVKEAKKQFFNFLEFLLGPCMCRCEVDEVLLSRITHSAFLVDVAAKSGARITHDRDLNFILILSADSTKVQTASEMIKVKLEEGDKLYFIFQLEPAEDWLVSNIIGIKGASIRKLRKQTGCNIDVDSKERRIVLSSESSEVVSNAKAKVQNLINKARDECVFLSIPEKDMSAFVGRAGAHIREFEATHGVDIQIMKNMDSTIRITGEAPNVQLSQKAVQEWLTARNEVSHESETAVETLRLTRDKVPTVIGPKGSVIRSLEKEFGCRIDIDRKTSVLSYRGGTVESRISLREKIENIVTEEKATNAITPNEIEASIEKGIDGVINQGSNSDAKNSVYEKPNASIALEIKECDFPELVDVGDEPSAPPTPQGKWACGTETQREDICFVGDINTEENVVE